jgi:hypothetical protein
MQKVQGCADKKVVWIKVNSFNKVAWITANSMENVA